MYELTLELMHTCYDNNPWVDNVDWACNSDYWNVEIIHIDIIVDIWFFSYVEMSTLI